MDEGPKPVKRAKLMMGGAAAVLAMAVGVPASGAFAESPGTGSKAPSATARPGAAQGGQDRDGRNCPKHRGSTGSNESQGGASQTVPQGADSNDTTAL